MGNLELATFCVKHAAELTAEQEAGMPKSATQEAIVQSFLQNYDKVNMSSRCILIMKHSLKCRLFNFVYFRVK